MLERRGSVARGDRLGGRDRGDGRRCRAVDARHGEIVGAAGAHGHHAAGGYRIFGARWLGGLAGEEDRRAPCIGGRRHPGIDAGNGSGGAFPALKGLAEAGQTFGAGHDEADDEQDQHQEAQRVRVARSKPWRRNAGAQAVEGGEHAPAMGLPQHLTHGVVGA